MLQIGGFNNNYNIIWLSRRKEKMSFAANWFLFVKKFEENQYLDSISLIVDKMRSISDTIVLRIVFILDIFIAAEVFVLQRKRKSEIYRREDFRHDLPHSSDKNKELETENYAESAIPLQRVHFDFRMVGARVCRMSNIKKNDFVGSLIRL